MAPKTSRARGNNEWHARKKERPWRALGMPVVVYTWLGMH
jgi:hypothetical protein